MNGVDDNENQKKAATTTTSGFCATERWLISEELYTRLHENAQMQIKTSSPWSGWKSWTERDVVSIFFSFSASLSFADVPVHCTLQVDRQFPIRMFTISSVVQKLARNDDDILKFVSMWTANGKWLRVSDGAYKYSMHSGIEIRFAFERESVVRYVRVWAAAAYERIGKQTKCRNAASANLNEDLIAHRSLHFVS